MKRKAILLTEIISPYRIPVFNAIAKRLGHEFLALFFGETESRRQWQVQCDRIEFDYQVLPGFRFQRRGRNPFFFNPTVLAILMKHRPEVLVLGGYHHPTSLLVLAFARLFETPLVLWGESNLNDERSSQPMLEAYKRWFMRHCTKFLAVGTSSRDYFLAYGVRPKDVHIAPNAVDNDFFFRKSFEYRQNNPLRELYPYQVILYVGRVIQAKGVMNLICAYEMIANQVDAGLLIVGDGQDKDRYEVYCRERELDRAQFIGFVHQEELPMYYALADVFVFPTHSDPWGFVLNEALACGLPVISTDVAGAMPDLVRHGRNGYVFSKGDVDALAAYLLQILRDDDRARAMGQESLRISQDHSPERCAAGFLRVIAEA
jgi:glycosyltransferase involved in cell wall biosynthesis